MGLNIDKDLNKEQAQAAKQIEGPVLIIAGAGSGKTRVLIYRIANMLEHNIDPKNILALTFTNKAAKELQERINSLITSDTKGLTSTTFHSFGLGLLKRYIGHLGYKYNFTIYDTRDNEALAKEAVVSLGYTLQDYNINSLLSVLSDIKMRRRKKVGEDSAIKEIYDEFVALQKAYNVVDFDDLIALPIQIMENKPEVLAEIQEKYKYIMVDEFQDTSIMQYKFISLIANKYKNLCVVGDDDQSIYSWRGADYQNIVNFEKDYPERKEIILERNYRSTGTILEAANTVILNNKERKQKKLYTDSGKGSSIYFVTPENETDEAYLILRSIQKAAKEKGLSYSDFGILVRTNSLMETIENTLVENHIPVLITGAKSFFDRKEIRDLISYLKVLVNEDDDISFLRIVNTPRRGIGRTSIEKIRSYASREKLSLFDAMSRMAYAGDSPIKGKSQEALKIFTEQIVSWQSELENNNKVYLFNKIVNDIHYRAMLHEEYPDNEKLIEFKMKGLSFLSDRIARFERNHPKSSLRDYLNLITLDNNDDKEDDIDGKVNLLTMHAAKGLEFEHVFMAGIEEGFVPSAMALEENPKNIDEERRLFYVSITRAKKELTISSCLKRTNRMKVEKLMLPSRFLKEIPTSLLDSNRVEDLSMTTDEKQDLLADFIAKLKAGN